uniref:Small ribosomal subunit protein uS17 N-terminal domain-containing protein n=1 Tax=Aureoumbra lagunensis TaxID=44058 RepID=A0A7S3K1D5_9STRA|mmetsp:Transcript_4275/g.6046  ORF Transcript_4275/g.6046 Transcript_4275/m.6046 type:complete len:166 (-) Transcript_4275:370-867(-)
MPNVYREAEQTEKAYQKQDAVFIGRKRALIKKSKKGFRYVRNVGLGFKIPKNATEGNYVDKKCPYTGNVSIRGRILKGMVISTKMKRTLIIRRDYLNWCGKYRRFEKRHKNMAVHCSPCFDNVKEGDIVTVGQCRPLTKTVRFNVLAHEPAVNQSLNVKKVFRVF